jgi:hypothetical protein
VHRVVRARGGHHAAGRRGAHRDQRSAGADAAALTIHSVEGDRAEFTMNGRFLRYDEEGKSTPVDASAKGAARIGAADE